VALNWDFRRSAERLTGGDTRAEADCGGEGRFTGLDLRRKACNCTRCGGGRRALRGRRRRWHYPSSAGKKWGGRIAAVAIMVLCARAPLKLDSTMSDFFDAPNLAPQAMPLWLEVKVCVSVRKRSSHGGYAPNGATGVVETCAKSEAPEEHSATQQGSGRRPDSLHGVSRDSGEDRQLFEDVMEQKRSARRLSPRGRFRSSNDTGTAPLHRSGLSYDQR